MNINISFFQDKLINAINAGIYIISIEKNGETKPLYIGESFCVLIRCSQHLYEFKKSPEYFGFDNETINDKNVTLKFELIESIEDQEDRKSEENKKIKKYKPLCQSGNKDYMKPIPDKIKAVKDFLNEKN